MIHRGRDYLQVGNATETFRRNNTRFIAINNGIDSADPNTLEFAPFINKDYWLIDEEAAKIVRLIFALFMDGKNRNQIAVHLKNEQILTPTFYLKQQDRGNIMDADILMENIAGVLRKIADFSLRTRLNRKSHRINGKFSWIYPHHPCVDFCLNMHGYSHKNRLV